jgi:hypothetical protein
MESDDKTLEVTIRNNFGTDHYYPYCGKAEIFAILTGKKTLTINDITWIKSLGYTFKVKERKL